MSRGLRAGWRKKFRGDTSASVLRDVFEARHDLAELAQRYGLEPEDLAGWASDDENRGVLQGLCVLADLQTQLMLSRYRQLAVTELIRQATGGGGDGEGTVSAEQARKACVDLLRADLKPLAGGRASASGESSAVEEFVRADADLRALRSAIYGAEHTGGDMSGKQAGGLGGERAE